MQNGGPVVSGLGSCYALAMPRKTNVSGDLNVTENTRVSLRPSVTPQRAKMEMTAKAAAELCGFGTDAMGVRRFIFMVNERQDRTGKAIWLPGREKLLTLRRIYDHLGDVVDPTSASRYFVDRDVVTGWNVAKISGAIKAVVRDAPAVRDVAAANGANAATIATLLDIVDDLATRVEQLERDLARRQRAGRDG